MPLFSRRSRGGAASDPFPSGSHGTGVQDTTAKLTLLRGVTGPEAREGDLLALLERHGGDVNAAINTYLDAGVHGAPQPPPESAYVACHEIASRRSRAISSELMDMD